MNDRRLTRCLLVLAALMLVALPITAYFVCYIALTQEVVTGPTGAHARVYATGYQAHIFKPAAKIETLTTGRAMFTLQEATPP